MDKKQEILNKAHIEWLLKAETAKINGNEMTVLPYGFLIQAISQSLDDYLAYGLRECLGEKTKPFGFEDEFLRGVRNGQNGLREQIIENAKEKFNIKI